MLLGRLFKHLLQRSICCCFLETFTRHWQKLGLQSHIMTCFIQDLCCHVTNHVAKTNKSTFFTWQVMLQIKMWPTSAFFWKKSLLITISYSNKVPECLLIQLKFFVLNWRKWCATAKLPFHWWSLVVSFVCQMIQCGFRWRFFCSLLSFVSSF